VGSVALADGASAFAQETLAFEILLAHRAGETLTVVIVVHGFDPTVTGLDGITTGEAFGGEQFIPIRFAVGKSVLQVKVAVAKQTSAISARKTFRMELLANSVQTVSFDPFLAACAGGRQEVLEARFAVERFLFLDETDVR